MQKRFLCILLCLVMLVGILPIQTLANAAEPLSTRSASLTGRIYGRDHGRIDAGITLTLTGDSFDFSKVEGYDTTTKRLPAGNDLTDYLLLETPAGGSYHLFNAADQNQGDQMMAVNVRGTGSHSYHGQVNMTVSGNLLKSGKDLVVTPSDDCVWAISPEPSTPPPEDGTYDLWFFGTQVTEANKADILGKGKGEASFDRRTNTLTLRANGNSFGTAGTTPMLKSELDHLTLRIESSITMRKQDGIAIEAKNLTIQIANPSASLTVIGKTAAFSQTPLNVPEEIFAGADEESAQQKTTWDFDPTNTSYVRLGAHQWQWYWETVFDRGHWLGCKHAGCYAVENAGVHVLEWYTDEEPYGANPGKQHKECQICGYKGQSEPLPGTAPGITTDSLLDSEIGMAYKDTIMVTGTAPLAWQITSGTLPDGLTLNSETGEISGTPKETGTFVFTVKVINKIGEAVKTYSITVNPGMDISKLFTEKKTGCTNGSKDISQANGEKVIKKNQQYDFLYAAISHSMRNASQKEFDAIAGKLYNVLYKAAFRPRCFGATRNTIARWPLQNARNCGTSVEDAGLGQTVKFASSKGCASYAHFVSNYVYGQDGKSSYQKGVRIKSDADEFKKYFEAHVDPGETINYNYKNGREHWIVFLGESEDERGFYFISYEGGLTKSGDAFHNLNVGYWTYRAFASHVDNKKLSHWDTNKGSFSSGKYTALKIVSHCPVEMIVACGDAVLDSRELVGSKTTALGTMTATGEGANRSVTVDLNTDAGSFDLTLIGTDNGVMDLTVTHTYEDEEGNPQELTRQYSSVPVIKNGQITGLIPVDGDQTIQLDVPNSEAEGEMEYWLANPGDNVTGPEEGYYPYNPNPDDNEMPNISSDSSDSSSVSNPSSVMIENIENGHVTISPETASKGETVTLTVQPNKGYTLETLTVTDKDGNEIELTDKGDGRYTFKMPGSKVTVKAAFMEDNSMLNFFVDVPADAYYYDAVLWAAQNGITGGVDDTHFAPNAACTRAQAVTFLWRAAGSPAAKSGAMHFTDIPDGSYYYDAVLWAIEQGITRGTSDTTFSPNAACTRAQIVTFLWRSQKSPAADGVNPFTDVAADAYYNTAVLWAAENGITGGTTATTFSPSDNCTRAQIVAFLFRCLGEE